MLSSPDVPWHCLLQNIRGKDGVRQPFLSSPCYCSLVCQALDKSYIFILQPLSICSFRPFNFLFCIESSVSRSALVFWYVPLGSSLSSLRNRFLAYELDGRLFQRKQVFIDAELNPSKVWKVALFELLVKGRVEYHSTTLLEYPQHSSITMWVYSGLLLWSSSSNSKRSLTQLKVTHLLKTCHVSGGTVQCLLSYIDTECLDAHVVDVVGFIKDHNTLLFQFPWHHVWNLGIDHVLVVVDDDIGECYHVPCQEIWTPPFFAAKHP